MLQIPLLLLTAAIRASAVPDGTLLVSGGLYSLLYVGIWWWGVGALTAIDVTSSLRRAVFLGLLQPLGMALAFAAFFLAFGGPMFILTGTPREAARAVAALVVVGLAAWLYSWACDWVRGGATPLNHQESQSVHESEPRP